MNRAAAKLRTSAIVGEDIDTRDKLKCHARRLFGERGIDNVAVRDILAAAGQRNVGAIGYYFGSKDELLREITIEGAALIDRLRNSLLDQLESQRGSKITVRDLISVIVQSTIQARDEHDEHTYVRFFATVHQHNHALFVELLGHGLDEGFRRCITHLRRLLPHHPHEVLNERIRLLMLLMGAALSLRETALEHANPRHLSTMESSDNWGSENVLEHLIDACEGILCQPMSIETGTRIRKASRVSNKAALAPKVKRSRPSLK